MRLAGSEKALCAVALATACALSGLPASAQDASPFAAVEPCLGTHFDLDQYHTDFLAQGWEVADGDARLAAAGMLADALMPVTSPGFDWAGADTEAAQGAARDSWAELLAGRDVYAREGEVLVLRGRALDDGTLRVECFIAAGEGPFSDLFTAFANSGLTEDAAGVTRAGIAPRDMGDGALMSLYAADARAIESPELAAPIGFLVRVDVPPE